MSKLRAFITISLVAYAMPVAAQDAEDAPEDVAPVEETEAPQVPEETPDAAAPAEVDEAAVEPDVDCAPGQLKIESTCENPKVSVKYVTRYRYVGAKKLRVIPGEDPPAGYEAVEKPFTGVWIAGLTIFASMYAIGLAAGLPTGGSEGYSAVVPGIGPFISAGFAEDGGAKVGWSLLGTLQVLGISMFAGGLTAKRTLWIREDLAATDGETGVPNVRVGLGSVSVDGAF